STSSRSATRGPAPSIPWTTSPGCARSIISSASAPSGGSTRRAMEASMRFFSEGLGAVSARKRPVVAMAALAARPLSLGCIAFEEGAGGDIPLETHVTDWRQEVIYQVLIDRFADGDAGNNYRVDLTAAGHWHGGDYKGLEDHLDYLQELGVTTLWISPVVKNV